MKSRLLPYKIGLGVVGLFTLILLIVVVVGAGNYKHDNDLFQQASSAANKLNNYVNNNQTIPSSLSAAGVNNTSSDIAYTKLSDTSYRFCVNYKGNYNGFSAAQVEQQILSSAYGTGSTGQSAYGDNTALYLNPYFHKGENCQTVKPMIYPSSSSSSDPYSQCYSISDSTAYDNCINQVNNQLQNTQNQQPSMQNMPNMPSQSTTTL